VQSDRLSHSDTVPSDSQKTESVLEVLAVDAADPLRTNNISTGSDASGHASLNSTSGNTSMPSTSPSSAG
jgi:hypothetical protein